MQLYQYHDLQAISYQNAWDFQSILHQKLLHNKLTFSNKASRNITHHLIFCEHSHVYTLGKSGSIDHLLINAEDRKKNNIEYFKINRGGDITYHGPGQITGYPILDLDCFYRDVHRYVRDLEEVIIQLLATYGIMGHRIEGYTGVWLGNDEKKRKICAIGVHMSRWVTLHGFALNVNTNLDYFEKIIPCGIKDNDKTVTSLQRELGRPVDMNEVKSRLQSSFLNVFGLQLLDFCN